MVIPYHRFSVKHEDFIGEVVSDILRGSQVCRGIYIKKLEGHFEHMCGCYAVACANCTSGLVLALKHFYLSGKSIVLPSFTWYSTLHAVECAGAKPIFTDIHKDSWLLDINSILPNIYYNVNTHDLPVDTFGNQYTMSYNTKPLVIDAAHGYGLPLLGKRASVEVVSLSYTKVVSGIQGGMILTQSKMIADSLRDAVDKFAKLSEVHACIALESIQYFSSLQGKRLELIHKYRTLLRGYPITEQVVPNSSNYSVYSILFETGEMRDKIAKAFVENGIEVKIYYEPLKRGLPNTENVFSRIISLPIYVGVWKNVDFICDVIKGVLDGNG